MSHRVFDEIAELQRRLDVDADIAALRSSRLVDLVELLDLRNTRDTLAAQLAAKEEAV